MIQSNIFAATVNSAGIKKSFVSLQNLLAEIADNEDYLHEYASGEMFDDMVDEFTSEDKDILDNKDLFGDMGKGAIATTKAVMRRVHKTMILINDALDLIESMYQKVNKILNDTASEYISREKRTENLISWALRKGLRLNQDSMTKVKMVIETKSYSSPTDLWGVLDLFDDLRYKLETMKTLPAYYRTSTSADTQSIQTPIKVVIANRHESLETIALRELGSADKAPLLMQFNDLGFIDIHGDEWDGKKIKIPYKDKTAEGLQDNYVLDSHTSVNVLGRDLSNTLTTDSGDFQPLQYTDTLKQSLQNIISTPLGAIPESPNYGNRVSGFMGASIDNITEGLSGIELSRVVMTDPRVEDIANVKTKIGKENIRVTMQVKAVNNIIETELSASTGEII